MEIEQEATERTEGQVSWQTNLTLPALLPGLCFLCALLYGDCCVEDASLLEMMQARLEPIN